MSDENNELSSAPDEKYRETAKAFLLTHNTTKEKLLSSGKDALNIFLNGNTEPYLPYTPSIVGTDLTDRGIPAVDELRLVKRGALKADEVFANLRARVASRLNLILKTNLLVLLGNAGNDEDNVGQIGPLSAGEMDVLATEEKDKLVQELTDEVIRSETARLVGIIPTDPRLN